ncbi:MAG: sigma-70 family RNA polymerase sigma factor [Candidatus Omnitrophota bacterium]
MDDLDFVRRCCQGDKQAWGQLISKYSRLIYSYINSVLSARSFQSQKTHAEDIFQEIFHSLVKDNYHKLKSYKGLNNCSLASWLRQVTINFTISYLRRQKPEFSLDAPIKGDLGLKDVLSDGSLPIPDVLNDQEKVLQLKECIDSLNPGDKFFLRLHILKGVKLEKLKDFFRVSRGAIDMQKSRIVERLKDCFRAKGFALDF